MRGSLTGIGVVANLMSFPLIVMVDLLDTYCSATFKALIQIHPQAVCDVAELATVSFSGTELSKSQALAIKPKCNGLFMPYFQPVRSRANNDTSKFPRFNPVSRHAAV